MAGRSPLDGGPPAAVRSAVVALAEAILPEGGAFEEGATTLGVGETFTALWREMQPRGRLSVAAMVASVQSAAVLRTGRSLQRLDVGARTALCDALEHGGGTVARSAYLGIKTLLLVLLASDPRLERRMGSDGWPPQLIRP